MAEKNQSDTKSLYKSLGQLFDSSHKIPLKSHDKWVIFSDLHMGDGGSTDDFKDNSELFQQALAKYYLKKNHVLILNGDVEELQRFKLNEIVAKWRDVYDLFDQFHEDGKLFKTIGNHDLELSTIKDLPFTYKHYDGLRLQLEKDDLFIFHGHQASKKYQRHNQLIGFTLKYFANPLGIRSYSVSHSSKKQYKIEKRVYGYSAFNKVVSIIGHTHRPLFESLHKVDRLKFSIEQLCRDFLKAGSKQEEIKKNIKQQKKELKKYFKEHKDYSYQNYVYNSLFHIPVLFNSGCVVGKRGMTCIEIEGDKIRLVHWFDKKISKKYLNQATYKPKPLGNGDFYRMVIKEESLNYIFTRIKLLA
jgi:predicted phosphodiesterase